MSINDEGFFSPDLDRYQRRIRADHPAYFELVKRANAFCQKVKSDLKIHKHDGQEILAACLFLKILEDVQGAVILLERGMLSQGRSLLRVAIEAFIILSKVCDSKAFVMAFLMVGEAERLKLANSIRESKGQAFEGIREKITDELLRELKEAVDTAEIKSEKVRKWAEDLKLTALYDSVYRLFSQDVHSMARSLENYLILDEREEFQSFRWGPYFQKDFSTELLEAVRLLLVSANLMDMLFNLNVDKEIKSLMEEMKILNETWVQTHG